MAEYNYTREFNNTTKLYNIDYHGEVTRLAEEISSNILNKTTIKTSCNDLTLVITIIPDLTSEEKTTLDNLVADHT